jgi:hypothetical protein
VWLSYLSSGGRACAESAIGVRMVSERNVWSKARE